MWFTSFLVQWSVECWEIPWIQPSGEHFASTSNVALPARQPGGWSARGQPCDAVHSIYRRYMTFYQETCFGYRGRLMQRAKEIPVLMSNGNIHLTASHEDSVMAAIYAWQRLSKRRKPSEARYPGKTTYISDPVSRITVLTTRVVYIYIERYIPLKWKLECGFGFAWWWPVWPPPTAVAF